MFVIRKELEFSRTVQVHYPDPEQVDGWVVESFTARFRSMPRRELKRYQRDVLSLAARPDDAEAGGRLDELLADVMVGWDGVEDAAGKPAPFSREVLLAALDDEMGPFLRVGIVEAWAEAVSGRGREERRLGNSGRPRGR